MIILLNVISTNVLDFFNDQLRKEATKLPHCWSKYIQVATAGTELGFTKVRKSQKERAISSFLMNHLEHYKNFIYLGSITCRKFVSIFSMEVLQTSNRILDCRYLYLNTNFLIEG